MSRKAILVGIENYLKNPLIGCKSDAESLFHLLKEHADGRPNFQVKVYSDEIKRCDQLLELAHQAFEGEHEIALFYFSGHGALNDLGSYLLTPDHSQFNKGVAVRDILQLAAKSKSKSKIIILDCCHAGAAGKLHVQLGDSVLSENTIILASSREKESSAMIGHRSIFTELVLEAILGGAADLFGKITPAAVYAYVDRSLGAWSQRPVFKANVDFLISLREVEPPISLAHLRQITKLFPSHDSHFKLDPSYEPTKRKLAVPSKVQKFTILQKLNRVGLVVPVDADAMYWAAINKKSCKLTPLGQHYWNMRSKHFF